MSKQMSKKASKQILSNVAEGAKGVGAGVGTKYLWEAFKLPGYGVGIGPELTGPKGNWQMGVDDVLMLLIGAGFAGYGAYTKNTAMVAGGLGFMGGEAVIKATEVLYGARIIPPGVTQIKQNQVNQTSLTATRTYSPIVSQSTITYGAQATQVPFGQQSIATRGRFG